MPFLDWAYTSWLDTGNHSYEHEVVPLAELEVPAPNGPQSAVDAIRLSLHIPYSGTRTVFNTQQGA
ncbi:MAG TPA: hypothetical protein VN969_24505 [Streptosporangiaceae bacterium]|nr:hypothetical protein [Streptosporangiaceae bacterium]